MLIIALVSFHVGPINCILDVVNLVRIVVLVYYRPLIL